MSDKIIAAEMETDARTWNFYHERVVATVVVDEILAKVFQGKRPDLREQMLSVAAKATRRIEWSPSPEELEQRKADATLAEAMRIAWERRGD